MVWFNGLSYEGIQSSTADTGTESFWFNGLPASTLFSAPPPTTTIIRALLLAP